MNNQELLTKLQSRVTHKVTIKSYSQNYNQGKIIKFLYNIDNRRETRKIKLENS